MSPRKTTLLALMLTGLSAACGGDDETDPEVFEEALGGSGAWTTLSERPCPEDSFVTYEDFGGPLMISYCNGCHSQDLPEAERQKAPFGVDFDTVEQIRKHAERIWQRSGDQNATMPPIGGPSEEDRALLGEWLACGAPTYDDLE